MKYGLKLNLIAIYTVTYHMLPTSLSKENEFKTALFKSVAQDDGTGITDSAVT